MNTKKINLRVIIVSLAYLLIGHCIVAQDSTKVNFSAEVKGETSQINFKQIRYENSEFTGTIKSNLIGSKYTIDFSAENYKLNGTVQDKHDSFLLNLKYNNKAIGGEVKHYYNQIREDWEITYAGEKLVGKIERNVGTKNMYEFSSENYKVSGYIQFGLAKLIYHLNINGKPITGTMKYHANASNHMYSLNLQDLSKDEFGLFLLLESIRCIDEWIEEIEEFQEN